MAVHVATGAGRVSETAAVRGERRHGVPRRFGRSSDRSHLAGRDVDASDAPGQIAPYQRVVDWRPRRQPPAVRRPRQLPADQLAAHLPVGSPEGRGHVNRPGDASGGVAHECDLAPVWRPAGGGVSRRVCREAASLARTDHLDVDVPVVARLPVPREGDLIAVRGERGEVLGAGGRGHRDEMRGGRLRAPGTPKEETARRHRQRPCHPRRDPKATPTRRSHSRGRQSRVRLFLDLLQLDLHVEHVLEAPRGFLAKTSQDDPLQFLRHVGHESARRLRLVLQERGEHLGCRAAPEWPPARHHLVQHGPEGEDVAARVHDSARGLLR